MKGQYNPLRGRLARDIGALLERNLARESFDAQRFQVELLLLLGWRRGTARAANDGELETGPEEMDIDPENEAFAEENPEPEQGAETSGWPALREEIELFRFGNPYLFRAPGLPFLLFQDFYGQSRLEDASQSYLLPWTSTANPVAPMHYFTVNIAPEAMFYVQEVLLNQPIGPSNGAPQATSLHRLLEALCRCSSRTGDWETTTIGRRPDGKSHSQPWFDAFAARLQDQRQSLGDNHGGLAHSQREKFGPYWCQAGDCGEEAGEAWTLDAVLQAAPAPLQQNFSRQADCTERLSSVIHTLSEYYERLRLLGLPPQEWWGKNLSVENARDLLTLRNLARDLAREQGKPGADFAAAFQQLTTAKQQKSLAGGTQKPHRPSYLKFHQFGEWRQVDEYDPRYDLANAIDAVITREANQTLSLDDLRENSAFEPEDHEAQVAFEALLSGDLARLMDDAADELEQDPVLRCFFAEVMAGERGFAGDDGLLFDPAFQALLKQDKRYGKLSDAELGCQLEREARRLVFDKLMATCPTPVSAPLRRYMQTVLFEGGAARGANGLFNRKSFQALLAEHPSLQALASEALEQRLNQDAREILREIFGGYSDTP